MARVSRVKKYLEMDVGDMSRLKEKELRHVVQVLSDAANKRIKRINEAGLRSAELGKLFSKEEDKKFSPKGKNLNQLREEYGRLTRFYKSKTSSVKGAREHLKNAIQGFKDRIGIDISPSEFYEFTDLYNELRIQDPNREFLKYEMEEYISIERAKGYTFDQIKIKLQEEIENIYKLKAEETDRNARISTFFVDDDEGGMYF